MAVRKKFVKICPRCGSLNIGVASGGVLANDFCRNRNLGNFNEPSAVFPGFAGNFPEFEVSEVENFRKGLS